MSNEAYLIATDIPGPTGVDSDTYIGHEPGETVAHAPLTVPVFWLALFDTAHIMTLAVTGEDDRGEVVDLMVPSLVAELADARRRLRERRELLAETFPEFRPTWDRFAGLIRRLTQRFVKVDTQELWDMEPEEFQPQLEAAVRWFDSRSGEDFEQLLVLASIRGYDQVRRTFPGEGEGVPRAFHMRGYADSDGDWDNDSEL